MFDGETTAEVSSGEKLAEPLALELAAGIFETTDTILAGVLIGSRVTGFGLGLATKATGLGFGMSVILINSRSLDIAKVLVAGFGASLATGFETALGAGLVTVLGTTLETLDERAGITAEVFPQMVTDAPATSEP